MTHQHRGLHLPNDSQRVKSHQRRQALLLLRICHRIAASQAKLFVSKTLCRPAGESDAVKIGIYDKFPKVWEKKDGRGTRPFGFRPHRSQRATFPHRLFPRATQGGRIDLPCIDCPRPGQGKPLRQLPIPALIQTAFLTPTSQEPVPYPEHLLVRGPQRLIVTGQVTLRVMASQGPGQADVLVFNRRTHPLLCHGLHVLHGRQTPHRPRGATP